MDGELPDSIARTMNALSGTARQLFSLIVTPLLDFFYPAACLSCGSPIPPDQRHVCRSCRDSITRLARPHPLYEETKAKLCIDGIVDDLESVCVFEEDGVIRVLVHALKYRGRASVGLMLGVELGNQLIARGFTGDLVIPVPLHRIKERERGYNQADLIARGVSGATGMPNYSRAIIRRKHTQTQTLLSIDERKQNMEGAFELRDKYAAVVKRSTCIVIDDVITTGSTIVACASVLKEAGAARVIAASVALAK